MIKQTYSLKQLFSYNKINIGLNKISNLKCKCPFCKQDTFNLNMRYSLGICSNCNTYVDFIETENICNSNNSDNKYFSILEEGLKHKNKIYFIKELEYYKISNNIINIFNVGYYPNNYWVKKEEDWKYGRMLFPMYSLDLKLINICGEQIGKPSLLTLQKTCFMEKCDKGIFNPRGILNEKVHIYLNPIECLQALSKNQNNSVFLHNIDKKIFEIFPIKEAVIYGNVNQNNAINNIKDILIKNNINTKYFIF